MGSQSIVFSMGYCLSMLQRPTETNKCSTSSWSMVPTSTRQYVVFPFHRILTVLFNALSLAQRLPRKLSNHDRSKAGNHTVGTSGTHHRLRLEHVPRLNCSSPMRYH